MASLEDKLKASGGAVKMLRSAPLGPYVYPVPAEYSNWRDEQRAWREDVALIDQSFHMTDLYVQGPDVIRLLSDLAINSFEGFGRDKAKQLVACSPDGFVIGDMIVFGLEDDKVDIVGRPVVANWVQFKAETGGYQVTVERDERSVSNPKPRKTFRYELQGPKAWGLLEELNGGPIEAVKFFHMGVVNIAGHELRCLRHGMGGAAGLEFWGPVELGAEVKAAILKAGQAHGLRQVGGRAYSSICVDSGWIPSPLPAIYTGEAMRPYREWLGDTSFEAIASLGGSFVAERIEDYYLTPWDLDYGRLIRFDHDFVGRGALQRMAEGPHRRKVSLEWNAEDVLAVQASQLQPGGNGKWMEVPTAHYASHPYDAVRLSGAPAGFSTYPAYFHPDRAWVSLGVVDERAGLGDEVEVTWGEPDGGTPRPVVERHVQKAIRARVRPWPWAKAAREGYRPG
ncbi:MAG TPA: aminomethyl transferase family protein [Caulobacteraceae bacterium]|jgi:glycine cleavage system aminomethyltransferase T